MLSSGGGKVMGTDGNLRHLRKLNPDVLIGMPTFIYHLLHLAAQEGVQCPNLRRIILGGEKVSDGLRNKLRALSQDLGSSRVDVLATYGFTEAKQAWPECPFPADEPPSGYHLYPDLGIVEVIDPQGKAVSKPLLHTSAAGMPDYSELFVFGWSGTYTLRVNVVPGKGAKPVKTSFTVNHSL